MGSHHQSRAGFSVGEFLITWGEPEICVLSAQHQGDSCPCSLLLNSIAAPLSAFGAQFGVWEFAPPTCRVMWSRTNCSCECAVGAKKGYLSGWHCCGVHTHVHVLVYTCAHVCLCISTCTCIRTCVWCACAQVCTCTSAAAVASCYLFLPRHSPGLTTMRGETTAASSWPSPRAWKPASWSKCLWWCSFLDVMLLSQSAGKASQQGFSLQHWVYAAPLMLSGGHLHFAFSTMPVMGCPSSLKRASWAINEIILLLWRSTTLLSIN